MKPYDAPRAPSVFPASDLTANRTSSYPGALILTQRHTRCKPSCSVSDPRASIRPSDPPCDVNRLIWPAFPAGKTRSTNPPRRAARERAGLYRHTYGSLIRALHCVAQNA